MTAPLVGLLATALYDKHDEQTLREKRDRLVKTAIRWGTRYESLFGVNDDLPAPEELFPGKRYLVLEARWTCYVHYLDAAREVAAIDEALRRKRR